MPDPPHFHHGLLDRAPVLQDFIDMRPPLELREQLALATGFTQRIPSDGSPATRRTDAYMGYDEENLYVVFVAFDDDPGAVRARMSRREDIDADDRVTVTIDTDGDQQRGYEFSANPFGIQRDGLWTEGAGADFSFDTLWHSEGTLTDKGYVVLMSIPFKSLRFPRRDIQTWGIVLWRWTPRGAAEEGTWPHVSSRIEGVLNQAGLATGLTDISPGRNIRLIPLRHLPLAPGADRDTDRARLRPRWFNSQFLKSLELNAFANFGTSLNFVPALGNAPEEADSIEGNVALAFRPNDQLRLSGRWLYQSLRDPATQSRIFRSDILRARVDWQYNRELSLRVIVQYESLAADPTLTRLPDRRNVNADVLVTYLVNPWTSFFAGYNSNHQNLELLPGETGNVLRRTQGRLLNDANQLFVKVSYLFSY